MAKASTNLLTSPFVQRLKSYRTLLVPIAFIGMIALVVVPIPPAFMDVLISANIALAVVILLTTLYVKSPLDFSVLPSLLLG